MKLFLPVEIICQQLDTTWQYFTTAFKVQVAMRDLLFSYNYPQNILPSFQHCEINQYNIPGPTLSSVRGAECLPK